VGLYVSTTGSDAAIPELGFTLTHPSSDYSLGDQFSPEELKNATALTTIIRAGTLIWKKTLGGAVQAPTDYDPDFFEVEELNTGLGQKNDRVVSFKNITDGTESVSFDNATVGGLSNVAKEMNPPEFSATSTNGTLTLTSASKMCQFLSGSATGFSIVLPNATTLSTGWKYEFYNTSTKSITLKDNSGTVIFNLASQSWTFVRLQVNSTAAGTWFVYQIWGGGAGGSGVTPPFVFSKSGGTAVGSYLYVGQAVTSKTGQEIVGTNRIVKVGVSNSANVAANTKIQFQRRTALSTFVDIAGAEATIPSGSFRTTATLPSPVSIGPDWEISCYNKSGSTLSDPIVVLYLIPE
jgi:hypothetical protein